MRASSLPLATAGALSLPLTTGKYTKRHHPGGRARTTQPARIRDLKAGPRMLVSLRSRETGGQGPIREGLFASLPNRRARVAMEKVYLGGDVASLSPHC